MEPFPPSQKLTLRKRGIMSGVGYYTGGAISFNCGPRLSNATFPSFPNIRTATNPANHNMKYAPTIASTLLGLLFIMSAVVVLFGLVKMPPPPEGTPAALFMGAFVPTGYMTFVKVLELVGGILLLIPRMRNFGLLVIGPILVNILAFHFFIMKGAGLLDPMLIVIAVLAAYVLWCGRRAFAGLLSWNNQSYA